MKIASPLLVDQANTGDDWSSTGEHRSKRQAIIEGYENGSKNKIVKNKKAVKEETTEKVPPYS